MVLVAVGLYRGSRPFSGTGPGRRDRLGGGAALRERRRRPGPRVLERRRGRGPHQRALATPQSAGHRAQHELSLQGQRGRPTTGGARSQGRGGTDRTGLPAGRHPGHRSRARRRRPGDAALGRAIQHQDGRHLRRTGGHRPRHLARTAAEAGARGRNPSDQTPHREPRGLSALSPEPPSTQQGHRRRDSRRPSSSPGKRPRQTPLMPRRTRPWPTRTVGSAQAGQLPYREAFSRAKAAATRALEIDETPPRGAHGARSGRHGSRLGLGRGGAWVQARDRARPQFCGRPSGLRSSTTRTSARCRRVLRRQKRAVELDPLSPRRHLALFFAYYFARQYDQALEPLREATKLDPDFNASLLPRVDSPGKGNV